MRSRIKLISSIIITLSLTWWFGRPIFENIRKVHRLEILRAEIRQLERQKRRIEDTIEYYKTDVFIEKEARDRLNMVKPGEKIVIITDNETQSGEVAGEEDIQNIEITNWEKWRRLFFE